MQLCHMQLCYMQKTPRAASRESTAHFSHTRVLLIFVCLLFAPVFNILRRFLVLRIGWFPGPNRPQRPGWIPSGVRQTH